MPSPIPAFGDVPSSRRITFFPSSENAANDTIKAWPQVMDPEEYLDYAVDFSRLLNAGETIDTYEVKFAELEEDLTIHASEKTGNVIAFWVGGEINDTVTRRREVLIRLLVNTTQGRVWQRTSKLIVNNL